MKNLTLSFRAQRLDNQDPDHMELDQRPLAEEDVAERQELARKISKVSLDGSQVFSKESHTAFLLDDKFLLKTPSDQLDDAGRIASIVCYGRVPEPSPASWSGDVVEAVVGFAGRIGRTISGESRKIARRGVDAILEEAEKKRRMRVIVRKVVWGVGVLVVVLAVLGVIYKIFFRE